MTAEFVSALVAPVASQLSTLHLFDGPYVVNDGRRLELPDGSKRLLVLVALSEARVERGVAAGTSDPAESFVVGKATVEFSVAARPAARGRRNAQPACLFVPVCEVLQELTS